jgi:cyclophilin family peptidyl-prolyl cis-trans isomerase
VAKRTHDKELARARDKREKDKLAKRQSRTKLLVAVMVGLLVLSLVGAAAIGVLGGDDGGDVTVEDEPPADEGAAVDDETAAADDGADADAGETGEDDTAAPGEQDDADAADDQAADARPEGACPPTPDDVPEVDSLLYDEAPELTVDEDATYTATIATTCGDIVVELEAAEAPLAVNSFVFLAEEGYYEGVGFHRVIQGFVAQAGDPAGTGCGREDCGPAAADQPAFPGYTFEDELDLAQRIVEEEGVYPQGTLAMANAGPDTNGSQWFIVEPAEGVGLPPDYTVFGRVLEGQEVVEAIVLGPVSGDVPVDPVIITSVTIETS